MYGIKPDLTKEYILSYVSQKDIFEHFLNITVKTGEFFCSPIRSDKHPTCNFSWYDNRLWYRDWAEKRPKDCFQIVQDIYDVDFYGSLELIEQEMIAGKESNLKRREPVINKSNTRNKGKSKIRVKFGKWKPKVIKYLKSYGISSKQCEKFNIKPIQKVWVNDRCKWNYWSGDPALGYYFGNDKEGNEKWKIYFFERENKRFLCNTNRINGWVQLPRKDDYLIITKSLKDVVCFDSFGISSIAMQNETTMPYDYIIEELKNRFNQIITILDYDDTGIQLSKEIAEEYDIPYYFIKDDKAKDFSDYIKIYGKDEAEQLIKEVLWI